jgi:DNA-directed RNA polymerase subunit H (RpoH/RPB5)
MDGEREYYPYRAYLNLLRMAEYRQLVITDYGYGTEAVLDPQAFTRKFQEQRFCLIAAKNADGKEIRHETARGALALEPHTRALPTLTYMLLVVPDSPDLVDSESLRSLLRRSKLERPAADSNAEVLLIHRTLAEVKSDGSVRGEEGVLKTHVLKTLRSYESVGIWSDQAKKKATDVPDMGGKSGWRTFQPIPYDYVLSERPKHVSSLRYEVLSMAEEAEVLQELRISRHQLKDIRRDDVIAIWYGLIPDMVVRVYRETEVGGNYLDYLHVRPAKILG